MKLLRSEMLKHEMHRGFAAVHIFHQGSKFHSTAPQAPFHAHRAFHVRSTFHDGVISFIFGGRMSNNVLVDMSMVFAAAIVTLCDGIKGKTAITNQLLRSGTSIGANIHEAQYAQRRKDFISKL